MSDAFVIDFDVSQADAKIAALNTKIAEVSTKATTTSQKVGQAFSRDHTKHLMDELARVQKAFNDINSALKGTNFAPLSNMAKAFDQMKNFDAGANKLAMSLKRVTDFDRGIEHVTSTLVRYHEVLRSDIKAVEDLAVAQTRANAKIGALRTPEGRASIEAQANAKLEQSLASLVAMQKAYLAGQAQVVNQAKEFNRGLEQESTFAQRTLNTNAELNRQLNDLVSGFSRANAALKEEIKGMEQAATHAQRLSNTEAELARNLDISNRSQIERTANLRAALSNIERAATQTTRMAGAESDLRTQLSGSVRVMRDRIKVLEEENRGLDLATTFSTRMANAERELQRTTSAQNQDSRQRVNLLREEVSALRQADTFEMRHANALAEENRIISSLRGGLAATLAIRQAERAGLARSVTFTQNLANEEKRLLDIGASLRGGMGASNAQLQERNKGLRDAATESTKLANEEARLVRLQESLRSGMAGTNAVLQEEAKGVKDLTTLEQKLINQYEMLVRMQAELSSGMAREAAIQAEVNKGVRDAATQDQAWTNALAALDRQIKSLEAGKLRDITIMQERKKVMEAEITEQAKLEASSQALARAEARLATDEGKLAAAAEVRVKGIRQLVTYEQELANTQAMLVREQDALISGETRHTATLQAQNALLQKAMTTEIELAQARDKDAQALRRQIAEQQSEIKALTYGTDLRVKYTQQLLEAQARLESLTSAERQEAAELAVKERLLKREAELRARQSTEIRALLSSIKELENAEKKALGVTNTLTDSMHRNEQAVAAMRAAFAGMGASFGSFASSTLLVSTAVYSLMQGLRSAITYGSEFEDQINRVAAITVEAGYRTNEYQEALSELEETAMEIGRTSRYTANQAAQAMKEMAMSGLDVRDIMVSVRDVMNLATIGELDFAQASDIATNIMMGFGLQAEELAHVVDVMSVATVRSNANVQQLGNTMSYVAPVANAFGVSVEAVSAATMILANAGIKASRAGTGLRQMISSLFTPTDKGAKAMESYGISLIKVQEGFEDIEGAGEGMPRLVDSMTSGTDELIKKLKQFWLATAGATENLGLLRTVVNIRAVPAITLLIRSLEDGSMSLADLTTQLEAVSGAQDDMIYKMSQVTSAKWDFLTSALKALGTALFDITKSDIESFLDKLTGRFTELANSRTELEHLVGAFKSLGAALIDLAKYYVVFKAGSATLAIGAGISAAVYKLSAQFTALMRTMTSVGAAATLMWRKVLLPVAIVSSIGAVLYQIEAVKKAVDSLADIWNTFTGKRSGDYVKDLTERFEQLYSGGLADLYAQKQLNEDKIRDLQSQGSLTADNLTLLQDELDLRQSISKEIAQARADMITMSRVVLNDQLEETRKKMVDAANDYAEAMRRANGQASSGGLSDSGYGGFSLTGGLARALGLAKDVQDVVDESRLAMIEANNAFADVRTRMIVASNTERENLEWFNGQMQTQENNLRLLQDTANEYSRTLEQLSTLQAAGKGDDETADRISRLQDSLAVVNLLIAQTKQQMDQVAQATTFINKKAVDAVEVAKEMAANLQDLVDNQMTKIGKSTEVTASIKLGFDFSNLDQLTTQFHEQMTKYQALLAQKQPLDQAGGKEYSDQLKTQYAALAKTSQEIVKLGDAHTKMQDILAKYDPSVKIFNEMATEVISLSAAFSSNNLDMDRYEHTIQKVMGSMLQLDTVTGELTQTSRHALEQLRDTLTETMQGIAKQIGTLNAKPQDSGTRAAVATLVRQYQALSGTLTETNGVLDGTVRLQTQLAEESGRLEATQEALLSTLEAVGREQEANRIRNKQALAGTDDTTRAVTELKNAYQELLDLQTQMNGFADSAIAMQDFFTQLPQELRDAIGGIPEVKMIDTSGIDGQVSAATKAINESITGFADLSKAGTEAMNTAFDSLETRVTALKNALVEAVNYLQQLNAKMPQGSPSSSSGSSSTPSYSFGAGSAKDTARMFSEVGTAANTASMALQEYVDHVAETMRVGKKNSSLMSSEMKAGLQENIALITQLSEAYGLNRDLVVSLIAQESGFNRYARSGAGAIGLMQVMPATAREVAEKLDMAGFSMSQMTNPLTNLKIGMAYLAQQAERYNGDMTAAMVAYNGGPSRGDRYAKQGWAASLPTETRNYPKIIAGNYEEITQLSYAATAAEQRHTEAVKQTAQATQVASSATQDMVTDATQVASAQKETEAATKAVREATVGVTAELQKQPTIYEQISQINQRNIADAKELAELQAKLNTIDPTTNASEYAKIQKEQATVRDRLNKGLQAYNSLRAAANVTELEAIKLGKQLTYSYELSAAELEEIARQYGSSKIAQQDFYETQSKILKAQQQGVLSIKEANKAIEEQRDKLISTTGAWGEYYVSVKNSIPSADELGVTLFDDIRGKLVDALVDGGEIKMDDFVDMVKRKLAEIAINTIVVNIVGNILGVNGGQANVGGVNAYSQVLGAFGGGGGGTSWLSSVGSMLGGNSYGSAAARYGSAITSYFSGGGSANAISGLTAADMASMGVGQSAGWNSVAGVPNWSYGIGSLLGTYAGTSLFKGKYVGIGSSIGSTLGSVGGAYAVGAMGGASGIGLGASYGAAAGPIGAIVGAIIGGIAGGWLSSKLGSEPRQGNYATSFSGKGMEDNVSVAGGFGLHFGLSDKGTVGIDAAEYKELMQAQADLSNTISSLYGEELSAKVKEKIQARLGDFNAWSKDFGTAFRHTFTAIIDAANEVEGEAGEGVGHLLKYAVKDLSYNATEAATQIEGALAKVSTVISLYGSDIGEKLGMVEGGALSSKLDALDALSDWVIMFAKEGQNTAAVVESMVTGMVTLTAMYEGARAEMDLYGEDFIAMGQKFIGVIEDIGMTLDEFGTKQAAYFQLFFSDEERAAMARDEALDALKEWNDEYGILKDTNIDSLDALDEAKKRIRSYLTQLADSGALNTEWGMKVYLSVLNVTDVFATLEEALGTLSSSADDATTSINSVSDFINSIKPEEITQFEGMQEMIDLFAQWGMSLPTTSAALYELIAAGKFTDTQLQILADNSEALGQAWSFMATLQAAAVEALQASYEAAKDAAREASQARLSALSDEHDAALKALEKAYNARVKAINAEIEEVNKEIDTLTDQVETFADVVRQVASAIDSLLEQTDGIDETRQRWLDRARKALDQLNTSGTLPDNINDIISGLSTVDQNDFATKAAWEAAVKENQAILEALGEAAGSRKSVAEQQLDALKAQLQALEDQLELAKEQYDAAVEAENDRYEAAQKAEEDRLNRELAALDAAFEAEKQAMLQSNYEQLVELLKQTGAMENMSDIMQQILTNGVIIANIEDLLPDTGGTGDTGGTTTPEDANIAALLTEIQRVVQPSSIPAVGFTSATQKLEYLLKYWRSSGDISTSELAEIKKLLTNYHITVPGFADGGTFLGTGPILVGERGQEIIWPKAPGYVTNADDTANLFDALSGDESVAEEVRAMRREVVASQKAVAAQNERMNRMLDRWEQIGMPQSRSDIYAP